MPSQSMAAAGRNARRRAILYRIGRIPESEIPTRAGTLFRAPATSLEMAMVPAGYQCLILIPSSISCPILRLTAVNTLSIACSRATSIAAVRVISAAFTWPS